MKRFKCLLTVVAIFLLASCKESSSMQEYVTKKMAEYSRTSVKFYRLTTREDVLDLSKCHPLAYYRTLTPPDFFGDIQECVAIKYEEGVLYAVSGSSAMYFWDNDMLTSKNGTISAIVTEENYWLPATVTGGEVADYQCIAAGVNPRRAGLDIDAQINKVKEMGEENINYSLLPLIQ